MIGDMEKIVKQIFAHIEKEELLKAQALIEQNEGNMCNEIDFLKASALFYITIGKCYMAVPTLQKLRVIAPEDTEVYYYLSYAYEYKVNDTADEEQLSVKNSISPENFTDQGIIAEREKKQNEFVGEDAPLVSIVLSCNISLAAVKLCIAYIVKHTSDIDYELIFVNNGLPTEVTNYFQQIACRKKKIVQITNPVGVLSYQKGLKEAEGKYLLLMSDDVIVTKNWLKNMVECIASDIAIGMVAPTSTLTCEPEAAIAYQSLQELEEQAIGVNVSNRCKWKEKLILKGGIILCRKACIDTMGFYDYGFNSGFIYDLSFRYRRGGYKLISCGDVFVHCSLADNQDTLGKQQDLLMFTQKFCGIKVDEDIDGEGDARYDSLIGTVEDLTVPVEILGVEVKCGDGLLSLKNWLKQRGIDNVHLSALVSAAKYYLDLKTICHDTVCVDQPDFLLNNFHARTFDYIILGNELNAYDKPFVVLQQALGLLKRNGKVFVELKNLQDVDMWINCLNSTENERQNNHCWVIAKDELKCFLTANHAMISQEICCNDKIKGQSEDLLAAFINKLELKNQEKMLEKWITQKYFFAIEKKCI